jgi:hypothetical protein
MPAETVTLALTGERIDLADFALAVARLDSLVRALSADVASGVTIEWVIEDLHTSSAVATVRGVADDLTNVVDVERVVHAYTRVGRALESGTRTGYSDRVDEAAYGLTALIDGRVEAIRLETAEDDTTITKAFSAPLLTVASAPLPRPQSDALGAIEGRVQTLQSRGSLRFTLYDTLHDKAVSCYLTEGSADIMRDAWDRRAIVEGRVRRDPINGRPTTIRGITRVTVLEEANSSDYRRARGAVPMPLGALSAEAAVRRLRDA